MPEVQEPVSPPASIVALIDEACAFADERDAWIERFGADRGHSGEQRLELLDSRRRLHLLAHAARMRRSVGFYGESQCGKSNLVSRIGQGLGARVTASGSLLVRDPSVPGAAGPWSADGYPGCIEFAKWLNPIANTESTGVICRLTTADPSSQSPPGCFRARMMSHADLVVSLAVGNADDTKYAGSRMAVQQEVLRVRDLPTERDADGFIGQLLVAWNFLIERWGGESGADARARDLIDSGWREYLRELFLRSQRPVWDPDSTERCPYLRMVGMLWSAQPELTEIFRRLLQASRAMGGADEVFVGASEACRSDQPPHHSILDVRNLDDVFDELVGARGVQVRYRSAPGEWGAVGIPRSMLSALVRELELPLAMGGADGGAPVDVLDYPGARPTSAEGQIDRNSNPRQRALSVFRRGKLNYLFLAGVGLQDSSALCLVVTGNGPLNAGTVVRQALRAWHAREDPGYEARNPDDPARRLRGGPVAERVDPPLAVAVSKSDMLINESADAGSLFGGRLRELEKEYCSDIPWLSRWSTGGHFRRVHWVHNPDAPGAVRLRDYSSPERASALRRIRDSYMSDSMVLRHVAEPDVAFDRLFRSPADVDALFESIAGLVRGVDRERRIVDDAVAALLPIVAAVERDYLGPDPGARVQAERREASSDVDALEAVLRLGRNPVAMLLRALQVSAVDVQRACRAAAGDIARTDPGEVGVLGFEGFYRQLSAGFVDRLERRLLEQRALAQMLRAPAGSGGGRDVLLSLRQHFAAMPGCDWFRDAVRSPVASMFQSMNAETLASSPVLGAVVSTTWNRCIVWLDQQPETVRELPVGAPVRRPVHASSAKILDHWRIRLPAVYEAMVDPAGAARPGNAELGRMRELLRSAVDATLGALRGAGVEDPLGGRSGLEQLEAMLRR